MKAPFSATDALAMTEVWEEKSLISIFNTIRDAATAGQTGIRILNKMSNNMLSVITGVGFKVKFELSEGEHCAYLISWDRDEN